jgi:hypothetical protein
MFCHSNTICYDYTPKMCTLSRQKKTISSDRIALLLFQEKITIQSISKVNIPNGYSMVFNGYSFVIGDQ